MEGLGEGAPALFSHILALRSDSLACLKTGRARESSVTISPDWAMLEEIEFHRLAKLRMEVEEPEDL